MKLEHFTAGVGLLAINIIITNLAMNHTNTLIYILIFAAMSYFNGSIISCIDFDELTKKIKKEE